MTNFQLFAALQISGLLPVVASQRGRRMVASFAAYDFTSISLTLDDFWMRLCDAVENYPAHGHSLMNSAEFNLLLDESEILRSLPEWMNDLAETLAVPGWLTPHTEMFGPIPFKRDQAHCWSSLPRQAEMHIVTHSGRALLDDFQIPSVDLTRRRFDIEEVLDGCQLVQIRSEFDWCSLVASESESLDFSGSPQATWHGSFEIPNFDKLLREKAVFISIATYLEIAYRPIDLGAGRKTMLAGWHPASIVRVPNF